MAERDQLLADLRYVPQSPSVRTDTPPEAGPHYLDREPPEYEEEEAGR